MQPSLSCYFLYVYEEKNGLSALSHTWAFATSYCIYSLLQ
ncbi:hypothetical protein bcere0009_18600 [Bacillus cereus R309803]|nr:hypothetical protein bcere0009_18600 [Bacillus cereus R309803]